MRKGGIFNKKAQFKTFNGQTMSKTENSLARCECQLEYLKDGKEKLMRKLLEGGLLPEEEEKIRNEIYEIQKEIDKESNLANHFRWPSEESKRRKNLSFVKGGY